MQAGNRGLKRDLMIKLETSALTPEKGEIIHFYAVNRWHDERPPKALSSYRISTE